MADAAPQASNQSSFQLATGNKYDSGVTADPFWYTENIDKARWNQSFPYQLLVVRKQGTSYTADQKWKFTLPIPPEAIDIAMPFAINTNLTLGGVIEEHAGAPLRMITLSGTTGVMPLRGAAPQLRSFNPAQAIFAGTIASARQVQAAATSLAGDFGVSTASPNLVSASDVTSGDAGKASGYAQFRLLQQFLERYAALKKTRDGRGMQLALAMWKDQAVYLVTPVAFNVRKAVPDALEYKYVLQFKAWKRVHLDGTGPGPLTDPFVPVARDPNAWSSALKALNDARRILEGARATIQSVVGDIDAAIFEPIRQTALFCKDAIGLPLAFADLPANVIADAKPAIVEAISVGSAVSGLSDTFTQAGDAAKRAYDQVVQLGASTNKATTRGGDPTHYDQSLDTVPANDPFANPAAYYDFFSALRPGDVHMAPSTVRSIVGERERVRTLGRIDFEELRDTVVQRAADYADAVGAGSPTYSAQYGRQQVSTKRQPTDDDFDVLFTMNRVALELGRLAASGTVERFKVSSIDYVAGLATRSGIAFTVPTSKFLVPFPYGYTLEQLAARYLGDRDRWLEIATLNGLQAPYVDEVGFDLPLLSNGAGNTLVVADGTNLYAGQQVWVSANNTSRTIRHVTGVTAAAGGEVLVQVDGAGDLARFSIAGQATLHAFLPGTVNSQMSLYIPSNERADDEDFQLRAVPGVDQFDPLVRSCGVDLLLTLSGDLAVTPDGDCRLAVGLTNQVQKARIRLGLTRGSLARHPEIGLAVKPGTSTADLSVVELATAARDLFTDDPSFTAVDSVAVSKVGPVASLGMAVGIAGTSQVIPITVDVRR